MKRHNGQDEIELGEGGIDFPPGSCGAVNRALRLWEIRNGIRDEDGLLTASSPAAKFGRGYYRRKQKAAAVKAAEVAPTPSAPAAKRDRPKKAVSQIPQPAAPARGASGDRRANKSRPAASVAAAVPGKPAAEVPLVEMERLRTQTLMRKLLKKLDAGKTPPAAWLTELRWLLNRTAPVPVQAPAKNKR